MTNGTAIFQKYLALYQYEVEISKVHFGNPRVAVLDTGKGREVHSEVALAFLLDSGAPPDHRSYSQKGHRKIQATHESQLFHTLVLIGTCDGIRLVLVKSPTNSPMVLKIKSIMLSAARRI